MPRSSPKQVRDVADFLEPLEEREAGAAAADALPAVALHLPCSLRHALGRSDRLRSLLAQSGWRLAETSDDGQCCGSAGAYSLLFPETSAALRERKISQLTSGRPDLIATANVGCRLHLAADSPVPVRHWIEIWDEIEENGSGRPG